MYEFVQVVLTPSVPPKWHRQPQTVISEAGITHRYRGLGAGENCSQKRQERSAEHQLLHTSSWWDVGEEKPTHFQRSDSIDCELTPRFSKLPPGKMGTRWLLVQDVWQSLTCVYFQNTTSRQTRSYFVVEWKSERAFQVSST